LAKENLPRGDQSQSESLEPEDCCPAIYRYQYRTLFLFPTFDVIRRMK
jgi:hypothetical protein